LIINTPETVPKSTQHLAAPIAESQATAPSATAQAAPDLSRRSLGEGGALPAPVFHDAKHHIKIFQGDCPDILAAIPASCVDLIFADPPYFLSNNGITCHAGRMVSVNKGQWDVSRGADANHDFNRAWLSACQRVLKPNGTIWVSGTSHVIHSVGFAMQQLGFKLFNDISWVKPNPPPNLSCRYFTHATETIIWAARDKKSRHKFNYKHMKEIAGQTNEIRLANPPPRQIRKAPRQAPHPKARRPPRTHPPSRLRRRRPYPRSISRRWHNDPQRTARL
jgi:DNA modification methylase